MIRAKFIHDLPEHVAYVHLGERYSTDQSKDPLDVLQEVELGSFIHFTPTLVVLSQREHQVPTLEGFLKGDVHDEFNEGHTVVLVEDGDHAGVEEYDLNVVDVSITGLEKSAECGLVFLPLLLQEVELLGVLVNLVFCPPIESILDTLFYE
jgi:hypothetical protein